MKYLSLLILFMVSISTSYAQAGAIDTYFSKYKDDDRFTMVFVSPKMFQMFSKIADGADDKIDPELTEVISSLKGLRILTTEHEGRAFYKEAISTINTTSYEELMTVRSEGDDVKFLVKDTDGGNIVEELLLLVGGDEFVIMSFIGRINLKQIGKLAKQLDIDGVDHLEKLDHD